MALLCPTDTKKFHIKKAPEIMRLQALQFLLYARCRVIMHPVEDAYHLH